MNNLIDQLASEEYVPTSQQVSADVVAVALAMLRVAPLLKNGHADVMSLLQAEPPTATLVSEWIKSIRLLGQRLLDIAHVLESGQKKVAK